MKKLITTLAITSSLLLANEGEVKPEPTQTQASQEVQETTKVEETIFKPTLAWLETQNKNHIRDFHINQFLKQEINEDEALKAISLVDNMTNEIFFNFANRFNHDETKAVATCMKMNANELLDSYADCIAVGLDLKKATKLSAIDLDMIRQKIEDKYPTLAKEIKVISSSIPFTKLIISKKDQLFDIYLNVDDEFRTKYFNYKLPKSTMRKILKDEIKLQKFIEVSLLNPSQTKVHKSLQKINSTNFDLNTTFLLALNEIKYKDTQQALKYLENALQKQNLEQPDIDKIEFWQYLLSKDETKLQNLATSPSNNFYSILAKEYFLEKGNLLNLDTSNYPLELEELLGKDLETKQKALLYTIARNKSAFNKESITKDFKLGLFALDKADDLNTYELFDSKNNFSKALKKLKKEQEFFEKPLFLLLAYDNKIRKQKPNFDLKNSYLSPFVRLEYLLFGKDEYKNFLVDYFIYYNLLKEKKEEKITFSSILRNLK